jgi:hypothetical protein
MFRREVRTFKVTLSRAFNSMVFCRRTADNTCALTLGVGRTYLCETQECMHVRTHAGAVVCDRIPYPAFEQDVIQHDNCRTAVLF